MADEVSDTHPHGMRLRRWPSTSAVNCRRNVTVDVVSHFIFLKSSISLLKSFNNSVKVSESRLKVLKNHLHIFVIFGKFYVIYFSIKFKQFLIFLKSIYSFKFVKIWGNILESHLNVLKLISEFLLFFKHFIWFIFNSIKTIQFLIF